MEEAVKMKAIRWMLFLLSIATMFKQDSLIIGMSIIIASMIISINKKND